MKPKDTYEIDVLLGRIQKVETPPFMLTRIEQVINNSRSFKLNKWQIAAASFSFLFLLTANVLVIKKQLPKKRSNSIELLSNSMNLVQSNQLYNE
jgi:hypothetical protein